MLLVRHYHRKVRHQGRHFTDREVIYTGFWIVGVKRLISSFIHKGMTCRKLRGKMECQIMSDLPEDRLEPSPTFTNIGVDAFGPWTILSRRTRGGYANSKCWAILFSCLSSQMGGAWERMIGITRTILDSMLLNNTGKSLTHDVLKTFMTEVSVIINSTPLVPWSTDPENPLILTPAMLLTQKRDYIFISDQLRDFNERDSCLAEWKCTVYACNYVVRGLSFWSLSEKEVFKSMSIIWTGLHLAKEQNNKQISKQRKSVSSQFRI
ncbi:uncharacterized protein [Palaemon carinicauda]|uniref:uncharacterized protein n=1 Tax=Palaemon carinicauda TaxID=392227 RepID=UPI0035B61CCD